MADRYELAFVKTALSATGTNPQEQGSLEAELFKRLLASGLTVSAAGVINTTVPIAGLVYAVAAYGAVGNGTTDDSAAITAAIAAAVAGGGGTVYLGPKTYSLGTTTIVIPNTVNLLGVGYASQLLYAGTGSAIRLSGSQFGTVGYFIVTTSNDAGTAIEAGTATRQSLLTHIYAIGPTTVTNTGAGFYLNAISGFSGGLTIYNCNATGFKFGVKFTSVNTSTDTWTAVDITSLWAVGRAAGVVAGSCGISFDANTNGVGTRWRGGTIEAFATGVKHVNGGFGGDIDCDFEGNTADVSVGSGFLGRLTNAQTGVQTIPGSIAFLTDNTSDLGTAISPRARTGYFGTAIAIGNSPATTGGVRLPNGGVGATGSINALNQAGNADISLLQLYSDNQIYLGQTGVSVSPNNSNAQDLGQVAATWKTAYLGTSVVAPGANGQRFTGFQQLTELTTIAAAATTDTTIQMPAGAVVLAVSVRVTVVIPTAATFTVGDSGSATRFSTAAVAVAANTTDAGTKAGAYYNAGALSVRLTPDAPPANNSGRVRVTIYYYSVTPPTS